MFYKNHGKRIIDFSIAFILLFIFSIPILVITLILFFLNEGHPFFFQRRPGLHENEFSLVKFKSMTDKRDESGELLPNHLRITRTGKFIRKYSLDELPQLFNVLKGDMSLVGPRPLLPKYLPLYNDEQRRRHEVAPGITGLAQVKGRNAISWEEKFKYDVWYVDNQSFAMDMKILYLTAMKVVRSEGVNSNEQVTMAPFQGS